MAEFGNFNGSKGKTSCITGDILMQLYIHSQVIMIHIQYKFHEVVVIGYLVMGNFMDFKSSSRAITHSLL